MDIRPPTLDRPVSLGRGLISAQPQTDRRELDEGKIVGGELVVAGGDTPVLLDLVEEPLDQVSRPVKVGAEADRLLAISFWRDVCPRAFLAGEFPDPVGVISAICEQSCSGLQFRQEYRTQPIVVCLTRCEAKACWQTTSVHDRVKTIPKIGVVF